MKLTDLDPAWWTEDGRRLGITFLCPLCRRTRIAVPFENPVDGGAPTVHRQNHWRREGDQFETISLFPSVDATDCCADGCLGWHGVVRFGGLQ